MLKKIFVITVITVAFISSISVGFCLGKGFFDFKRNNVFQKEVFQKEADKWGEMAKNSQKEIAKTELSIARMKATDIYAKQCRDLIREELSQYTAITLANESDEDKKQRIQSIEEKLKILDAKLNLVLVNAELRYQETMAKIEQNEQLPE